MALPYCGHTGVRVKRASLFLLPHLVKEWWVRASFKVPDSPSLESLFFALCNSHHFHPNNCDNCATDRLTMLVLFQFHRIMIPRSATQAQPIDTLVTERGASQRHRRFEASSCSNNPAITN